MIIIRAVVQITKRSATEVTLRNDDDSDSFVTNIQFVEFVDKITRTHTNTLRSDIYKSN